LLPIQSPNIGHSTGQSQPVTVFSLSFSLGPTYTTRQSTWAPPLLLQQARRVCFTLHKVPVGQLLTPQNPGSNVLSLPAKNGKWTLGRPPDQVV